MKFTDEYGEYTLANFSSPVESWKVRIKDNKPIFKYEGPAIGIMVAFKSHASGETYYVKPENVFASISIGECRETI